MTQAEIKAFFPSWAPPFFYDESYAVPSSDWLLREFFPSWSWQRKKAGFGSYSRRNDCDNYARAFAVAAQDAWANSGGTDDEGLAVGEFCYVRSDGNAHAIVAAFCESGLVFIEPQSGQQITLTASEQLSCFRASF